MAKLIDFDRKYMAFAAKALKETDSLKDEELENVLNDSVTRWLKTSDADLDGKTPDTYFTDMTPEELAKGLTAYAESGINVPEPLYRQIAKTPACAPQLTEIARNRDLTEQTRGTALRLLCDMEADGLLALNADMLLAGGELSDAAADWLKSAGYAVVEALNARYDAADQDAREAILDVLCTYPGVVTTAKRLTQRLLLDHEKRALHASYAARLGDAALLEPLKKLYNLSDLTYYDYMEIRNAIEAIGGDPGPERQFYGDPDYERLRMQED